MVMNNNLVSEKLALENHPSFKAPSEPVKLAQFLEALYEPIYDENGQSKYYIEVSKLHKNNDGSYMITESYKNDKSNYDKIRTRVMIYNSDSCTFFTVCPRDRKLVDETNGRTLRTSNSDVSIATVSWLDIDFNLLSEDREEAKEIAIQTIARLDPFPNILVETPGGYHLYFLLDDAYPVEDVSYTNRRMQKWTKADNCGDPARIMRIPVGWHRKDTANPKKVQIIHFDDTKRFTLDDFDHYPIVDQSPPIHERKVVFLDQTPNLYIDISEYKFKDSLLLQKIIAADLEAYHSLFNSVKKCPSRSEKDFHIICQLLKEGFDAEMIKYVFLNYPCGDKYREKDQYGDRYLVHQIESAQYRIEEAKLFSSNFSLKSVDPDIEYI